MESVMKKYLMGIVGVFLLFLNGSIAAVVYENNFNLQGSVAPGSPFSDNGWGAYITRADGSVTDETDTDPIVLGGTARGNVNGTANTYLWAAPKSEPNTDAGAETLLFSMDTAAPISLASLGSISVKESFDGSVDDVAKGRFAIQIGTDWYVSVFEWSSTTQDGAPASANSVQTLSGIDFTDGNNWLNLTATVGDAATGGITLGDAVGGTLTGDIGAFGVYMEHGNGGDHARIDDFQVTSADPVAYYVSPTPASWASLTAWDDGKAASSGTIYNADTGVVLETPATATEFPGVSLNLTGPQRMEIMASGGDVITVPVLTLDQAVVAAGVVDAGEAQLDGQISITTNSTFAGAVDQSRDLRILASVSGSTQVELSALTKTIYIDHAANSFSGTWLISEGTGEFSSAGAVGTASIVVQSNAALRILGDWDGLGSGGSLTVADTATAAVDLGTNEWTVSSLTIGASVIPDDTYTVSQLNAFSDVVFSGTGHVQVGPPPVPQLLVGWERWGSSVSPATIQTNGITGVATNSDFVTSQYAGSNDGTFGSLAYPPASVNSTNVTEGIRLVGAADVSVQFLIENTSDSAVDLGIFHFDALVKTVDTGPQEWSLSIVSGDLTIGGIVTNDLGFFGATSNLDDYDVDLTGLADHTLDAGGSVVFRLDFTGGAGSGVSKMDVDNVAITKVIDNTPTESPVITSELSGGNMVISWEKNGFKLQTRQNLAYGDWVDYPGGTVSPVAIPMTNDVEFLRLVWP